MTRLRLNVIELLHELLMHLAVRRRVQLLGLLGLIAVSTLMEVVSLGAVLPFIAVLVTPEKFFSSHYGALIADALGIRSASELALPLTLLFALIALLASAVRLFLLSASTRFSFEAGVDLSGEMYRRTLYQPYSIHASRNSAEVISSVTTKASMVITGVLLPALTILSSVLVLIAIVVALVAIDPLIAVASALGFGACYVCISYFYRHRLAENSKRIASEQVQLFKALQEGLGGIRDVLLDGSQPVYIKHYQKADLALRRAQGSNTFISGSPRFAMEGLGMVLLAGIAYFAFRRAGGIAEALPVLAALAVGAQRLIPAMQQAYAAWSTIAGNKDSLYDTLTLLEQPLPDYLLKPPSAALPFNRTIRLDDVSFSYGRGSPVVLRSLSMEIPKGSRIGIVGTTGSGKSTALDILMGLQTPTAGRMLVDDLALSEAHLRSWQMNIAHVPQSVYLSDATIAENIAFGIEPQNVDMHRVEEAAQKAQIAEYIESLPTAYNTTVGERGVRLSGGQRQRIGIARALYKRAQVLVMDEATSALDSGTEQAVMKAVEDLDAEITILIIAHRISTVRQCDNIVVLEKGELADIGTFDDLMERSGTFRKLAGSLETGSQTC